MHTNSSRSSPVRPLLRQPQSPLMTTQNNGIISNNNSSTNGNSSNTCLDNSNGQHPQQQQQDSATSPSSTSSSSSPWQSILHMVFDAMHMHSNGTLGKQLPGINLTSDDSRHLNHHHHHNSITGNGGHVEISMAGTSLDSWQRTPLLHPELGDGEDTDAEGWECLSGNHKPQTPGDYYEKGSPRHLNGIVKIDLPPPDRDEPKFPKEKTKTLMAFLFLFANWVLSTISLAIVHERLPDRNKVPPLPDIVFDLFPPQDWALDVSEYIIIVSTNTCLIILFLHKHRFIVLRRCFLILGLLYFMRSITMFVTQVPVASTTYKCSPKANSTSPAVIVHRALKLLSGFGLSINGQHTYCGDYIYSGHTVILTISYLVIKEYTPQRCYLLHWLSWVTSIVGVIMVLISRGHYTVDVLIAYYVTSRIFWMYHTMANNANLKVAGTSNYLSRLWWFCLFCYFERNVNGIVPRQYEWPLPWPRRLKKRDRNS